MQIPLIPTDYIARVIVMLTFILRAKAYHLQQLVTFRRSAMSVDLLSGLAGHNPP